MTFGNRRVGWALTRCCGGVLSGGVLPALVAVVPLAAQEAETIRKIEVIGAAKQSAETVIFKSGIKVGDDLRTLDLTAVLERLWATGGFDDLKFEIEDMPDGKKLILRVKERPVIKEVDYRGGTEMGLTNLKDKIKEKKLEIKPDSVYDPEAARKIKSLIVEQAAEKGFRSPVIDIRLEEMGLGVARLVFDIQEGGKVRIFKVAFRGNKVFSQRQLRKIMEKSRQHWSFSWITSHDLLVEKNLDEDLQNLKNAYWRKGFKDVFIGQPIIDIEDKTTARQKKKNVKRTREGKTPKSDVRATLTIPILEGEPFFEGTFKVEGNDKAFKETFYRLKVAEAKRDNRSKLAKFFNIKPSEADLPSNVQRPFDLDALNKGLDKVREGYSNLGYIQWRADKKFDIREEGGVKKVDVAVKVNEGEQHTIRNLIFEGNTNTKDKVLRRSMITKEGDVFSYDGFKDSFTGLGQLGFFDVKNTVPDIQLVPDKPQVDITIKGEEAGVNELLFQGGYGSLFGFSLGLSFSTKNLGGGGETLGFAYNGGKFQKNISISFTEPYVFDLPYSMSASISNGSTDYDASRVGEANAYKQHSRGIGVNLGTRLATFFPGSRWAFFTSYGVGYSFNIIRIEGGRNYFLRDSSNQLTSTFNQSLTFSTVNHPFKPTDGTKLSFGLEYGGWQFGGDRPFMRATWEFAKYSNLADRHIFAMNTSYGYLRNLSKEELSLYNLYRPGGENTIRGYRFGQVGTQVVDPTPNTISPLVVIGGNKQFIANFEYQFKIADQFRTVLFYDLGNAWAVGTKVFHEAPKRSTGIEFRFFLPISPAPLRLIWSRKLNPYPNDPDGRNDFQFSIGTTF